MNLTEAEKVVIIASYDNRLREIQEFLNTEDEFNKTNNDLRSKEQGLLMDKILNGKVNDLKKAYTEGKKEKERLERMANELTLSTVKFELVDVAITIQYLEELKSFLQDKSIGLMDKISGAKDEGDKKVDELLNEANIEVKEGDASSDEEIHRSIIKVIGSIYSILSKLTQTIADNI